LQSLIIPFEAGLLSIIKFS